MGVYFPLTLKNNDFKENLNKCLDEEIWKKMKNLSFNYLQKSFTHDSLCALNKFTCLEASECDYVEYAR